MTGNARVLVSAFACDPTKGSEPGNGWNWAHGLASMGWEVDCLTRKEGKQAIERQSYPSNLKFHYVMLPFGLERLYSFSQVTMYLYYLLWQWKAWKKADQLNKKNRYDIAHHVTWGSLQLGSFLYRLPVPFVFGPAGGGQTAPENFKAYFDKAWSAEKRREKISTLLLRFNPACKCMLSKATAVWVSNTDTKRMAISNGTSNVFTTLDAALPTSFFPSSFSPKTPISGRLNLLWVGRFLPRKGILLLLDVMEKLKHSPGIKLTVVGDGEQQLLFESKIRTLGLENNVEWVGKVPFENVKAYYASHDVFIFTSLRDSCPAQLIEAMAYGMPVITIKLHGQAEIVNEKTGICCPCSSPNETVEELKKAVLGLYQNPLLVTQMSKAAYEFALEQTWSNKIAKIIENSYPTHSFKN